MALADLLIDILENYDNYIYIILKLYTITSVLRCFKNDIIYKIYNAVILKFSKIHKIQKFPRKTNKNLIRSRSLQCRDPPKQILVSQTVEKLNGIFDSFVKRVVSLNFKKVFHFALKVLIIFNGYMAIFIPFAREITDTINKIMIQNYPIEYMMSMSSVEKTLYTYMVYIIQMFHKLNLNAISFQEATIDYLYFTTCFFTSEKKGVIGYGYVSIVRYIYVFASVFGWSPISEFNIYLMNILKQMTKTMISYYRNGLQLFMTQKQKG